jgi:hypothetical protein
MNAPKMSETHWVVLLVALAIIAMLVAFHAVVSGATQVGERRRQATAAQAAAVMRCQALAIGAVSKQCQKNLSDQQLLASQ